MSNNIFKSLFFFGTVFSLHCVSAPAATYYVDQTSGSDSNAGQSPSSPWKNCPGMALYTGNGALVAGDTVYFNRGDTWILSTGTQGLYVKAGVKYVGNSWGSGTRAILRAGARLEAGLVRIFEDDAGYETEVRGFEIDGNGQVLSGVDINHRYYSATSLNKTTKRVIDCIVHNTYSQQANGDYRYGIIISNNDPSGATTVENVEIINCVVHDVSRDGICLYPGSASINNRIGKCTVRGCEVYNTGQDPNYNEGHGLLVKGWVYDSTVEFNYSHDVKSSALFFNGPESGSGRGCSNLVARFNILTTKGRNGAVRFFGTGDKDAKLYGNVVLNSTTYAGFSLSGNSGALSLLVYNNTFYNAPVVVEGGSTAVSNFEFKNNIVYNASGIPLSDVDGDITSHSNNVFYSGTSSLVNSRGQNYSSTNLRTYEATGHGSDPLFKSTNNLPSGFVGTYGVDLAPNKDGLGLQTSSPGVNTGLSLGKAFASSINTVARPSDRGWDIGAYQNGLAGVPAPPSNLRIVSRQ
jgi:hypothetical protein